MRETSSAQAPAPIRGLRAGLAGWLAFGLMLVMLRGVQWDENYEFAQALTGEVKYPAGHLFAYWVHHLFTGQLYFTALLMKVLPGPVAVNAMRNVFFVWATVLPPYLLGAALGRRALAGHVAAVLMLAGVTLDFDASYPQFLLPGMFSNGHIGTGFALMSVAALALGRPATAFFLIGLMPAVHIGQTPQMLLFLGFLLIARLISPQPKGVWRRADFALVIGFVLSVAILATGYFLWPDSGISLSGASPEEAHSIWAGWVSYYDMHRRPPGILAVLLTAAFVVFAYLTMLGLGYAKDRVRFAWPITIVYIAGTLLIVLSILLVQSLLGARIPEALLTWLPYRLWNHLPPILVAGIAALLLSGPRKEEAAPAICLTGALVFLALLPALRTVAPDDFAVRYLSSTAPVLFYLLGATLALLIAEIGKPLKTASIFVSLMLAFALAAVHQFGFACTAIGAVAALAAQRIPQTFPVLKYRSEITAALLAAILIPMTIIETMHRQQLPIGKFERATADYLREHGEPDAQLAPPMGQVLLQAQTGHPVLDDLATPFYIGYRSSIGPLINTMYIDVYGMDFRFPVPARSWKQIWAERSLDEWRSLGTKYQFHYVVAPEGLALQLPEALSVNGRTLYRIE